ncbi:hypothetical protein LTR10_014998 [Elasticomyces elasticus]|nr:hypothetical protein LTR10_014998 [Elasticomyces elasticus]KAK4964575.1 hypothetical protein LTR42_012872 [Elasticomyces elasticus]
MDRAAQSLLHPTSPRDLQLDKTLSTQSNNKRQLHDSKPWVRLHYIKALNAYIKQNSTSTTQHSAVKMVNRVHFPWQQLEGARNAVILLHERFNLDEEQCLQVFKKVYLEAAQALRPDADISAYSISDAYKCRMRPDRKPWKVTYDGDKPDAAEKTRREGVRTTALADLQQAAQDLGLGTSIIAATSEDQEPDEGDAGQVDMQPADEDMDNEDNEELDGGFAGSEKVHDQDDEAAENDGPQAEEATGSDDELDVKELGQYASWTVEKLMLATGVTMDDPDHGKLLINYRTDAKKLKLSVVRHIERLINKIKAEDTATILKRKAPASSKRAKKGRKSAHSAMPDASMNTLPEIGGGRKARSTVDGIVGPSDESNTTTSKLRMVHWIDCVFESTSVRCGIERYVKTDSKLYGLGGPVFRVLINGTLQDVMVCIKGVCNNCRIVEDPNDTIAPTVSHQIVAAAENLLQGRPFVHTNDIDLRGLRQGGNWSYKGTSGPWSPTFPTTWTAGEVEFTFDQHRIKIPVMACAVGECEQCHAQTAADETAEGLKKSKAAVGEDGKEGRVAKKFGSGGAKGKS